MSIQHLTRSLVVHSAIVSTGYYSSASYTYRTCDVHLALCAQMRSAALKRALDQTNEDPARAVRTSRKRRAARTMP